MIPKLIIMLTHNDQTIENADKIFNECRDLPVKYWGFKNIGISENKMCKLLHDMQNAKKKTFLEVVTYTEKSCLESAKFACEHKFDYLLGTQFYPSVWEYLRNKPIQYYPFVGNVSGNPSVLSGNSGDMLKQINAFCMDGIPGIDLLAYRYDQGSPSKLAKKIVSCSKLNTIIAGSIDSIDRIKFVKDINPWGFTMGSALVNQKFVEGADFRTNLKRVLEIIKNIDTKPYI